MTNFFGLQRIQAFQEELQNAMRDMPRRVREVRDKVRALDREVTSLAVGSLIDELRRQFEDLPDVTDFLDTLRKDVVEHARRLADRIAGLHAHVHAATKRMVLERFGGSVRELLAEAQSASRIQA